MRPRRLTPDQRRQLLITQGDLSSLYQHPAWPTLEAEVDKKEARLTKTIVSLALNSRDGLTMEQQAYIRGFVHGMRWFTAVPASAERSLERYLQAQGVTLAPEEVADGQ
jgi:hypothetical protein